MNERKTAPRTHDPARRALSSDGMSLGTHRARHKIFADYSNIHQYFFFHETLGTGASGIVKRCSDVVTGEQFACKTIIKSSLRCSLDLEDLKSEVLTLRAMQGHPSVVKLIDVFEDAMVLLRMALNYRFS